MSVSTARRPLHRRVARSTVDARAVDALLVCIARFGLAKTTLDDVAREAGCRRATLYRYFDGKSELVRRTVAAEQARIAALVVDAGRAEADLAEAVVAVVAGAARELVAHAALQFLLSHEPEAILGHLAFGAGDRVLVAFGDAIAPAFDAWLAPAEAARAPATGSCACCAPTCSCPDPRSTSPTPPPRGCSSNNS